MKKLLLSLGAMSSGSGILLAHGGHTALESNFWHYALSPDHLFFLVVFLVAVGTLIARKVISWASAKSREEK